MLFIRTSSVSYLAIIDGSNAINTLKHLVLNIWQIPQLKILVDLVMRILRALCSSYRVLTLYTKERVYILRLYYYYAVNVI